MSFLKRDLRIHLAGPDDRVSVRLMADNGQVAEMRVFNISRSGLFLVGESPAKEGSDIQFEISDLENNDIRGRGRIVWQRNLDMPNRPKGAGILLTGLDKGSKPLWQSLLTQYLNQISAAQLMDDKFITVKAKTKIAEVAKLMQKNRTEIVFVPVDDGFAYLSAKEVLFAVGIDTQKSLSEIPLRPCLMLAKNATPMTLLQNLRYSEEPYTIIGDHTGVEGFIRNTILFPYLAEFMELDRERLEQDVLRASARLAHDLQTPLTIIGTSNHLLLSGTWSADDYARNEVPKAIDENCRFATALLADLLSITSEKLDTENLNLEKFDFVDLCKSTIRALSPLLAKKQQTIDFTTKTTTLPVEHDRAKMMRVLHNLLTNAMKYSAENTAIRMVLSNDSRTMHLDISDKGPGIEAAELPYIFEEFNRGGRGHEKQSFGLGLAIVNRIIKASGGVIKVTSQVGEGTTFKIQLPQKL